LERVTVHYRWSAWFGQSLKVVRRIDHGRETFLICELPAGDTQTVPTWMTDAALCAEFSLGPPEASAAALVELVCFLRALDCSVKADQQSDIRPSTENPDEANESDE
jgi:hypothetical protein